MFIQFNRRGQVTVLYALLIPLLFLFVGVGMDLGWYYLNVSRLQNAADAAALAGAQALIKKDNAFENYHLVQLTSNQLPEDFDDYEKINNYNLGNLSKYKTLEDTNLKNTLRAGRADAENYLRKNLSDATDVDTSSDERKNLSATDGWSISAKNEDKQVNGNVELRFNKVDAADNFYGDLYYVVSLSEKIRHFFLPGWFDDMMAPVKAVVLLQPHYVAFVTPPGSNEPPSIMARMEGNTAPILDGFDDDNNVIGFESGGVVGGDRKIIANWEDQDKYKNTPGAYAEKWNHYQTGIRSDKTKGIRYVSGSPVRTESVSIRTNNKDDDPLSSGAETTANGNKWYGVNEVDSINIDFRADILKNFTTDWDLGQAVENQKYEFNKEEGFSWDKNNGDDKRILFNAEFNEYFTTRDSSKVADPLWVRIESEPIKHLDYKPDHTNYNSVRQITLNFNSDNTGVENGHYTHRPYVIFYMGPENIDYAKDSNGVLIRHSQPVVINLNTSLNAIIYMPNSPVVINGNGNKLTGFVIARCFLKSVTEDDMTSNNVFELYDGFNKSKRFRGNYTAGIDGNDNTVYFKTDNLVTRSKLDTIYPNNDMTANEKTGDISVYEELPVNKQAVISFAGFNYDDCSTLAEYYTKTAAHVNSTYTKDKFKQFTGLTDDKVSMITFPNEDNNNTDLTIPVATADLLDNDPDPTAAPKDDKYVKVMVDGITPKYIEKAKLPYVKIRRNNVFPYVCIYDLKKKNAASAPTGFSGVRIIDDSIDESTIVVSSDNKESTADIFKNKNDTYWNSWDINKTLVEETYYKKYVSSKLDFAVRNGVNYFMIKTEVTEAKKKVLQIVANYHRIIVDGEDKYVEEDKNLYFTKIDNNATNNDNYIIVDEKGNILTKPITSADVFGAVTVDQNNALQKKLTGPFFAASDEDFRDYWNVYTREPNSTEIPNDTGQIRNDNGRYIYSDANHVNLDYRIPALERVYHKSTFNLSEDSCYSYFQIPELKRVNYTYLNVNELNYTSDKKPSDDMFFITKRAEWID